MKNPPTIARILTIPESSFFLFGARGVGKSTWLKRHFKQAHYIDLLNADYFLPLSNRPSRLAEMTSNLNEDDWVIIDEIQKIPALTDEVHRLIEDRKLRFALSGSSARKLKRTGANLLAGRAVQRFLFPLSFHEKSLDLDSAIQYGTLPLVRSAKSARDTLTSYVQTYLKEEIKEEGAIRQIEPFSRFLEIAGVYNGQVLNFENLARESHIPRTSAVRYFEILEDTLIAKKIEPIYLGISEKEVAHPKYYFFDAGVARACAGTLDIDHPEVHGRSFENIVMNELLMYFSYSQLGYKAHYYRNHSGLEADVVIQLKPKLISQPGEIAALEIKNSVHWDGRWSKNLLLLNQAKKFKCRKLIGIYRGKTTQRADGTQLYNFMDFVRTLHAGRLF